MGVEKLTSQLFSVRIGSVQTLRNKCRIRVDGMLTVDTINEAEPQR